MYSVGCLLYHRHNDDLVSCFIRLWNLVSGLKQEYVSGCLETKCEME
jgi:hypothetical protein